MTTSTVNGRKQLKEIRTREATSGATDFPMSVLAGSAEHNKIVRYIVIWQGHCGHRVGNAWTDLARAEQVRDEKIKAGTFLATLSERIAGYAM